MNHNQEKNQSVETDLEMTNMMELEDKDFRQLLYSPYAQEFRGKHKHEENRNIRYKKTQVEFLEMKIQHL